MAAFSFLRRGQKRRGREARGRNRKGARRCQRASRHHFRHGPHRPRVWDHDLRFVRVNKRLAEINGVPPEAHIGKRPHEILPEIDNIEDIYARWREIFATGKSWNGIEVKGATPAAPGLIRTWEENFYPIKVEGRVVNIGAVVEETTERNLYLEHVKNLVMELNHRCKNLLSIVLAIARQTSRGCSPDDSWPASPIAFKASSRATTFS